MNENKDDFPNIARLNPSSEEIIMKMILKNRYIKSYKFNNGAEFKIFLTNQDVPNKLILEEQGGEFWYCYLGYDSLVSNKLFLIGFDSDTDNERLSILFWANSNLIVLYNGNEVFIINDTMEVIASYFISTMLIGFYITESNLLLILEEAAMKLISENGKVLKNEEFDLLDDYYIRENQLYVRMNEIDKVIKLL